MSDEYIERKATLVKMWKALYALEDKDVKENDLDIMRRFYMQAGFYAGQGVVVNIPAADVRPVVFCKDCIHRDGTPGQPNIICFQMHDDDFCSYGEKK